MDLSDLISADAILPASKANSKKNVLQELSALAANLTELPERDISDSLLQRERLGSTGVGQGIAIPHGKFAGLNRIIGLFARLERPIDYEALDGDRVDMIFLLLAPESAGADHLKALARIARFLRMPSVVKSLRAAATSEAMHTIFRAAEKVHAA